MHTFTLRTKTALVAGLALVMLALFASLLSAEAVFLKDGKIVEGTIAKENDRELELKTADGMSQTIARDRILRVLYHENWKNKRNMGKMDGTVIEVYIVDEDKTAYTYRLDLRSAAETRIARDDVDYISRRKVESKVVYVDRVKTRADRIKEFSPAIRLHWGVIMSNGLPSEFNPGLLMADFFPYRFRNAAGNGLDLMIRVGATLPNMDTMQAPGGSAYYNSVFGVTNYTGATTGGNMFRLSGGLGVRYVHSFFIGEVMIQPYGMAYYQYTTMDIGIDSNTYMSMSANANGVVGGFGIDVGFSPSLGAFVEYSIGWAPGFPSRLNTEGSTFRFGMTLRTECL